MSPWQFTFMKRHCNEIFEMMNNLKALFLILVCWDDGIVCLNSKEIETLLDNALDKPQNLSVSRRPREKYRVTGGRNDKLKYKIADNQFPAKIFKG
jgi:hypothetical protein